MTGRWAFAVPALLGGAYYALAFIAALRRKRLPAAVGPGVSILKPVHGWDERLLTAILTHARQDYPKFELLLGVRDQDTLVLDQIRLARKAYPYDNIRVVPVRTVMPNGKAGALFDLAAAAAKYPLLVINDADICVDRDYLRKVVGPLADPRIGLVTALYRATAASFPACFEALGVATEFAPSVLVARLLGVAEFALGSTMALRASDLERIGGFRVIGDYLADDYQLGARITALGLHVAFADTVVETTLAGDWREVWRHQVRWSRTVRVCRPAGYYGYVVTQATFWSCLAAAAGYWQVAVIVLGLRMAAGVLTAGEVLNDHASVRRALLMPLRDLFGFAVWLAASVGTTVEWRGKRLQLSPDGRILDIPPST